MAEQNLKEPSTFKQEWEATKLLKRAKKKARKQLQTKGLTHGEANKLVKQTINRITSNKPERKAAGRGS
jgi:hypothetical protein